ncbi:MAG: B12-binding domain-containing radical SAM protein [Nitrospirae bacterium]|nr:B12-binding domain-containing radical SAM protein [Nitrospirota bacterium]
MRVLFVQHALIDESPVLADLSAFLKASGNETHLLIERLERPLWEKAAAWRPDLVAIPSSILAAGWALRIAREAKAHLDRPVILLGSLPTFQGDVLRDASVDYVCRGEAEIPVSHLCRALERGGQVGSIPGLGTKDAGPDVGLARVDSLDEMPFPDRDLYFRYHPAARFSVKKFLSSRGCLHDCSFCYISGIRRLAPGHQHSVRRKSVARVIDEIERVRARHPLKFVVFSDDLFGSHVSWLEEFAQAYHARVALPFYCNMTASMINERSVPLLARAGCRAVGMGVETGRESLREALKGMGKDREYKEACRRLTSSGIRCVGLNVIGWPQESFEEAWQTLEWNVSVGIPDARVALYIPLPGTPLGESVPTDLPDLTQGWLPERRSTSDERIANLYYLFRLAVRWPALKGTVRFLAGRRRLRLQPWFRLLSAGLDKDILGIAWWEALSYMRAAGNFDRRTANFPSLVS